jgi:sugar diacid utilization regulator/GAF domain-containing protein
MIAGASTLVAVPSRRAGAGEAALLQDAIARLARAAEQGQEALFSEARVLVRNALNADEVKIVVRSADVWREWSQLDGEGSLEASIVALVDGLGPQEFCVRSGALVAAGVSASAVALVIDLGDAPDPNLKYLRSLCQVLHLSIGACEARNGNPDKLDAIRVFQRVANRILNSGDLNDIFTKITHEAKTRLSADICGIMLKEDDWLVMQRCVGNLASETGVLRMRSGQGVAGRVFATREPCAIEDYVLSDVISRDFFHLARAERVKSALAVPLLCQNDVIGVLEVWRRRPSQFTPQHTLELATLANLASLAIENVRLGNARESAAKRLEIAHAELQARYDVIRQSAALQESLTTLLLAGGSLADIAELGSRHLAQPVLILDRRLEVVAFSPAEFEFAPHLAELRTQLKSAADARTLARETKGLRFYGQSIAAGGERFGWAAVLGVHEPTDAAQLALGEISTTIALHQMKERAAARALSDKLGSLLWDMIDAPEPVRRTAYDRVRDLGVNLGGDLCLVVCALDEQGRHGSQPPSEVGVSWRQTVAELPARLPLANRTVRLCTLRGDELILVAALRERQTTRSVAELLRRDIERFLSGAVASLGVSRRVASAESLPTGYHEARTALAVTRRIGGDRIVAFEQIGVAGLLLSLRDGSDFRGFVADKMAGFSKETPSQREALLETLRAYFAANCSQQATAQQLRLHQKTVAYRLGKIERISGLDLNDHESRMLLDLALRMNDLLS